MYAPAAAIRCVKNRRRCHRFNFYRKLSNKKMHGIYRY